MSHSAEPHPLTARRGGPLTGAALVPGDKSVSHRALILGRFPAVHRHPNDLRTSDCQRFTEIRDGLPFGGGAV
mgnify:CR=1 FL=1